MAINGIEGMTKQQLSDEIMRGGRFVVYYYAVSLLLITLRNPSDIYFVRSSENGLARGLKYSLLSLLLGWWGFPWGPIHTIGSLVTNFNGGKDVTQEVCRALRENGN
ncbi:MAG: hypothetical protein K8T91_20765 [Planctomycetes bacterium]|nr:hypothetical protein [Planctomycetota bacterium]